MSARFLLKMCIVVAALFTLSCSGESSSPTTPTPTPTPPPVVTPPPAPPPPAAPPERGRIEASAVPNPVPYSGEKITDVSGCASSPHTWFYDQILTETGGSTVTFTKRVDLFDNSKVNDRSDLNIVVPANSSTTVKTRWCSSANQRHVAESTFTGKDAAGNEITASAGVIQLLKYD